MSRQELAAQPCPMGGTHRLTQPLLWVGASCWKCHRTWEGAELAPTYPSPLPPASDSVDS